MIPQSPDSPQSYHSHNNRLMVVERPVPTQNPIHPANTHFFSRTDHPPSWKRSSLTSKDQWSLQCTAWRSSFVVQLEKPDDPSTRSILSPPQSSSNLPHSFSPCHCTWSHALQSLWFQCCSLPHTLTLSHSPASLLVSQLPYRVSSTHKWRGGFGCPAKANDKRRTENFSFLFLFPFCFESFVSSVKISLAAECRTSVEQCQTVSSSNHSPRERHASSSTETHSCSGDYDKCFFCETTKKVVSRSLPTTTKIHYTTGTSTVATTGLRTKYKRYCPTYDFSVLV
jgi:hypothetical protein